MKIKEMLILVLLGISAWVQAQTKLSLQQAYELALAHNFSIQIATNEFEITKKNNVIGNAGMLPVINGVVTQDNQVIDTKQKFLNGAENNRDGAKSNSLNAGVEMSWTLFNGMKMFATKQRLSELEAMGKLRLRQQIESTLSRVAKAYLDALLAKEQLSISNQVLIIGEKRLSVAQAKVSAGKSSKSEVLTVQVNLNADKAAAKRSLAVYKNSKLNLIQMLGLQTTFEFELEDTWINSELVSFESFKEDALKQNSGIQMSRMGMNIAKSQLKELKGDRYPSLQFRSGYTYTQQESEAGFLQSSNNRGLHYGLGLNLNLFNGFDVDRKIGIAKISQRTADLFYKDSLLKLEVAISQAYENYKTNVDLLQFEEQNVQLAQQNYDLAKEQQASGLLSINDLRIAEVNYIQSMQRKFQAAYEAKLSLIELERLSGKLMKQ
ncbi:MAG: TolC family protein [Bacteroidota bacterium]|nr:TolC family protein [Bacteroidota bacterium]